jgi:glycine oxidase
MDSFDIAVVGAGIIGSSIALECAVRGARVVLLERDAPGCGASGMAAGILAPCSEASEPGPFLRLGLHSLARWRDVAERLRSESGVDCELLIDGVLRVAHDEVDARVVQTRVAWQREAGVAVEWIDAESVAALEPALRATSGAAWYATEGQVNSAKAIEAIVTAARRRGVDVRIRADAAAVDSGGVLLTDGTRVAAQTVVLCAGPWTGAMLGAFGVPPNALRPVLGQLIGIRGLARPPGHVIYAAARGYALARRDGLVLVGASEEEAGFDTAVRDSVTATLGAVARGLLRGVDDATAPQAWTGLRPTTPDGLPLLGEVAGPPGPRVLVATGHYRNGVLLAPATAEGVAGIALDGVLPEGWDDFEPRRFGTC